MTDAGAILDSISTLREKTFACSSSDEIGSVIGKSTQQLLDFIGSNSDGGVGVYQLFLAH